MIQTVSRRMVLSLGVALGLGLAASPAFAAVDAALLGMIPPDATVVSGVHVEQAKASAFGRFVLSQMQVDDQALRNFIADTGFDPRRDLSEVMVVTLGSGDKTQALVLGRGVFNPSRLTSAGKQRGASVTNYRGVEIAGQDDGAIAFIDASIALAGNVTAVRAAIDQRASGAKMPADVVRKLQELSAANDAWFYSAVSPGTFFAGKMSNENLGQAMGDGLMQSITGASGGIKFGAADVKVSGEAVTRSEKDATALADVFRFLSQVMQNNNAQQKTGAAADAASLLSKLQLSTAGNVMKISMTIPEDVLERVFGRKGAVRAVAKR